MSRNRSTPCTPTHGPPQDAATRRAASHALPPRLSRAGAASSPTHTCLAPSPICGSGIVSTVTAVFSRAGAASSSTHTCLSQGRRSRKAPSRSRTHISAAATGGNEPQCTAMSCRQWSRTRPGRGQIARRVVAGGRPVRPLSCRSRAALTLLSRCNEPQ